MEGITPHEETGGDADRMATEALMQVRLAALIYGDKKDLNPLLEWSKGDDGSYAARFRELITEHPDLVAQFKDHPDDTLNDIREALASEETTH